MEQPELFYIAGSTKCTIIWEKFLTIFIKLTIFRPYNPVIIFLNICQYNKKTYVHKKACLRLLWAVLFKMVQTLNVLHFDKIELKIYISMKVNSYLILKIKKITNKN